MSFVNRFSENNPTFVVHQETAENGLRPENV
jgi:hypothetical protein